MGCPPDRHVVLPTHLTAQVSKAAVDFPACPLLRVCQEREAACPKKQPGPALGEGAGLEDFKILPVLYFHVFIPSFQGNKLEKRLAANICRVSNSLSSLKSWIPAECFIKK